MIRITFLSLMILLLFGNSAIGYDASRPAQELIDHNAVYLPLNPFQTPPNPWEPIESKWPEYYIDPVVDYGLSLVLPTVVQKQMHLDTGFNRWTGQPTIRSDMMLPFWHGRNQSYYMSPGVDLNGNTERLSCEIGYRRMLGSKAVFGILAFHDLQRSRGSDTMYIGQAGAGFELSVLPGLSSDLSVSGNVYFPTNEHETTINNGAAIVTEKLSGGFDGKTVLKLPAVIDGLDMSLTGNYRHFQMNRHSLHAYDLGFTVSSRDGLASAGVDYSKSKTGQEVVKAYASINVAFSINDVLHHNGWQQPAGQSSTLSPDRDLRSDLRKRADRRRSHPVDRSERRISLAAQVSGDSVSFNGEFPGITAGVLAVQTSQSPWRSVARVRTNGKGHFSGKLRLPKGKYQFRVLHEPTGRVSPSCSVEIH